GRAAEQVIEQVNEMYRVREGHAAVVARAFETAEVAPQNVHAAELSRLNCRAQPIRSSIEPEDVPDLQDASFFCRELGQLFSFGREECDGFLDEHIFPDFEECAAQVKVRLRRRYDTRGI